MAKNRNITTTQLALMTAAAVISLRGLPMMAQEELTMFFYIFFATFLFLIPAALVGAELGSAFASKGGGVYTWVKEAFNKHMGFTAIFLQWIQNVVWYPTVLGFAAASIAYMIGMPDLAQNGLFVGCFPSPCTGAPRLSPCAAPRPYRASRARDSSSARCCPASS